MSILSVTKPPHFLKLLAHDLRWQLLTALALSDRRVQELVQMLDRPQNLVSYHLRRLREQEIVAERRSSADGRDVYYSLELPRMRALYLASGESLHPALAGVEPGEVDTASPLNDRSARILFLCTHNSARSQMAEGLLRANGGHMVEAYSAGVEPGEVHPYAIRVMSDMNIDISQHRAKHLDEFVGQSFDYIITVCDRARESCPLFPGDPMQIHWSFADPVAVTGTTAVQYAAFQNTAREMAVRISYLLLIIRKRG